MACRGGWLMLRIQLLVIVFYRFRIRVHVIFFLCDLIENTLMVLLDVFLVFLALLVVLLLLLRFECFPTQLAKPAFQLIIVLVRLLHVAIFFQALRICILDLSVIIKLLFTLFRIFPTIINISHFFLLLLCIAFGAFLVIFVFMKSHIHNHLVQALPFFFHFFSVSLACLFLFGQSSFSLLGLIGQFLLPSNRFFRPSPLHTHISLFHITH
mmetsp:Transcript_16617/g.29106  ORF Transcript_16617/g.29106 Transcript_16617/m.29106 type:complete len:211 (+) Transcript_16617:1407-2039(+)